MSSTGVLLVGADREVNASRGVLLVGADREVNVLYRGPSSGC